MLRRYNVEGACQADVFSFESKCGDWVLYEDVEPLLKRLAELEAKEQKREQFEQECG